jgi:hypothetical protein
MDFIPGYVNVITSPNFTPKEYKIWVIGKENGKIYYQCNTKDELFNKINSSRVKNDCMICYSKLITFTEKEMNTLWNLNYWPIDSKGIHKIKSSFSQIRSIFF